MWLSIDTMLTSSLQCNGARPRCAACTRRDLQCHYSTEPSESRFAALKRTHARTEQILDEIRAANDSSQKILHALASKGEDEALALFHRVRRGDDASSLLREISAAPLAAPGQSSRKRDAQSFLEDAREAPMEPRARSSITPMDAQAPKEPHKELFDLLKSMPETESLEITRRIRRGANIFELLRYVRDGNLTLQLALVPETHRRYQFPYRSEVPKFLCTSDNPYLSHLLDEVNFNSAPPKRGRPAKRIRPAATPFSTLYLAPYRAAEIVDPYLWRASAAKWTTVIKDDRLLTRLLNSYFLHHYPVFPCVHKDYFLEDMVAGRNRFCSPLLVNTILAAACHADESIPGSAKFWEPSNLAYRFLAEAKRLWELQSGQSSLTTIQAATILNVICNEDAMDKVGRAYIVQAVAMAHDIDLFDPSVQHRSTKMQRARAFTAWSLFAWDAQLAFYYFREPLLPHAPKFELPDPTADPSWYSELWVRYPIYGTNLSTHLPDYIKARMEFSALTHEFSRAYFRQPRGQQGSTDEAVDGPSPAQIRTYRAKLQDWFDCLPASLAAGNIALPAHIRVHVEYYRTMIMLAKSEQDRTSAQASSHGAAADPLSELIHRAYIRIESLLRLYYVRHSFDTYDSYMLYYVMFLAQHTVEVLQQGCPPEHVDAYRSTLILCARGLHEQGKHTHLMGILFRVLRDLMHQRDRDLLLTFIKEEPGEDSVMIEHYAQCQLVVPIVNIHEDPKTSYISNIVKEYETHSMDTGSVASDVESPGWAEDD